jgi:serine/threonine protein phosphatase PrpC
LKFDVFQVSRKGGRHRNEDRMGYCYTRDASLFVLADGMGGHPRGDVAAELALKSLSELFRRRAAPRLQDPRAFLDEATLSAHRQMLDYATRHGMADSPRTTVVACVVQDGRATWAHCGDSRLYLVRRGVLVVRTIDHTYSERPKAQSLSSHAVNRNVLFTCLGSPLRPTVDMSATITLHDGDRLLLCSDGLWGVLPDREITALLGAHPLSESVPMLVERALRVAGPSSDNVTALAFEWQSAAEEHEGDFAPTAQFDDIDPQAQHALDDAAIERSIAEINEAIRRTTQRDSGA